MNKAKFLLYLVIIGLIGLNVSCEQLGFTGKDESPKKKKKPKKENVKRVNCLATSFAFYTNDVDQEINLVYNNGKVVKAEVDIFFADTVHNIDAIYKYDTTGNLISIQTLPANIFSTYEYDSDGRIKSISSRSTTKEFEYNDKNQIIKQLTVVGGEVYLFNAYEYSESGLPTICKMHNKEGTLTTTIEIEYDDKENPFKDLSPKFNTAEMIYGYPVGNCKHNIVKVTTSYIIASKWKIHGEFKEPNDVDVMSIKYVYDDNGYPVRYYAFTDTVQIEYDCSGNNSCGTSRRELSIDTVDYSVRTIKKKAAPIYTGTYKTSDNKEIEPEPEPEPEPAPEPEPEPEPEPVPEPEPEPVPVVAIADDDPNYVPVTVINDPGVTYRIKLYRDPMPRLSSYTFDEVRKVVCVRNPDGPDYFYFGQSMPDFETAKKELQKIDFDDFKSADIQALRDGKMISLMDAERSVPSPTANEDEPPSSTTKVVLDDDPNLVPISSLDGTGITYRVKLYKDGMPRFSPYTFEGVGKIMCIKDPAGSKYLYFTKSFNDYSEAKAYLKKMHKIEFTDAEVQAFRRGQMISLSEAGISE